MPKCDNCGTTVPVLYICETCPPPKGKVAPLAQCFEHAWAHIAACHEIEAVEALCGVVDADSLAADKADADYHARVDADVNDTRGAKSDG